MNYFKDFFVCPSCEAALCQKEKLLEFHDGYCKFCGTSLTSAKKEAVALVNENTEVTLGRIDKLFFANV